MKYLSFSFCIYFILNGFWSSNNSQHNTGNISKNIYIFLMGALRQIYYSYNPCVKLTVPLKSKHLQLNSSDNWRLVFQNTVVEFWPLIRPILVTSDNCRAWTSCLKYCHNISMGFKLKLELGQSKIFLLSLLSHQRWSCSIAFVHVLLHWGLSIPQNFCALEQNLGLNDELFS